MLSKYDVGLKTLLLQSLSEPEFYGKLVHKFRKLIGKNVFPYHFKKLLLVIKKIGYNRDVSGQTACSVVNPIKVLRCLNSGLSWYGGFLLLLNFSVAISVSPHVCLSYFNFGIYAFMHL